MSDAPGEKGAKARDAHEADTVTRQPLSVSRVDMMTEDFARLLSRRAFASATFWPSATASSIGSATAAWVRCSSPRTCPSAAAWPSRCSRPTFSPTRRSASAFSTRPRRWPPIEHQNVVRFFDLVVGDPDLPRHGAPGRPDAGRRCSRSTSGWTVCARDRHHAAALLGARCRASRGHRAPRHQAVEHHPRSQRADWRGAEADRLRRGQGGVAADRAAADARRAAGRDAALHVAGADHR